MDTPELSGCLDPEGFDNSIFNKNWLRTHISCSRFEHGDKALEKLLKLTVFRLFALFWRLYSKSVKRRKIYDRYRTGTTIIFKISDSVISLVGPFKTVISTVVRYLLYDDDGEGSEDR
jgi:hypothetical protein